MDDMDKAIQAIDKDIEQIERILASLKAMKMAYETLIDATRNLSNQTKTDLGGSLWNL